MSNALAMATVTASLRDVVLEAMQDVTPLSGPPNVTLGRPENKQRGDFVGANIYLYRVGPNAALRNNHLPFRNASQDLIAKPQLALDLFYVLSFYGQAASLESQRLMAATMTALELKPELTPQRIRQSIDRAEFLHNSDLDMQFEKVRFTLEPMSLEELSKLWTVFFQVTHELSVAYQASVVLLDAPVPITKPLPVMKSQTLIVPSLLPYIERLEPSAIDFQPGTSIHVVGKGLDSPSLSIMVGERRVQPSSQASDRLQFELPVDVLPGVNSVSVVPHGSFSSESFRSNVRPLLVKPVLNGHIVLSKVPIARITVSGVAGTVQTPTLQFRMKPSIGRSQSVTAWLNPASDAEPGLRPTSSTALMRVALDQQCRSELDAATVGDLLQVSFRNAGLSLPGGAHVSVRKPDSSWTIFDRQSKARYWASLTDGVLLLNYGVSAHDPEGWTAIDLTGVAPGKYLVRVQIGAQGLAETPLETDPTTGTYVGPRLDIVTN